MEAIYVRPSCMAEMPLAATGVGENCYPGGGVVKFVKYAYGSGRDRKPEIANVSGTKGGADTELFP